MSFLLAADVMRTSNCPWRTGAALPRHTIFPLQILMRDPYVGEHRIGTTQPDEIVVYSGQPASRRVTLFIREGGGFRQIRQTWSAADGSYRFDYIVPGVYWVMAEDHFRQKTIVTADPVQSTPMPT